MVLLDISAVRLEAVALGVVGVLLSSFSLASVMVVVVALALRLW